MAKKRTTQNTQDTSNEVEQENQEIESVEEVALDSTDENVEQEPVIAETENTELVEDETDSAEPLEPVAETEVVPEAEIAEEPVVEVQEEPEVTEPTPEAVVPPELQGVTEAISDIQGTIETTAPTIAEAIQAVAAPRVEKARTTKTVGKGVTVASPKVETTKLVYKEACNIQEFIKKKYGLDEENYPQRLKNTIRGINDYISNMRNGVPVNVDTGAKHQANWLRTILGALDTSTEEAMVCFDTIMFVASKHPNDLFNDRLAARFFNRLNESLQPLFLSLQKDIVNGCNVRTRQAFLSQTIIEHTVKLLRNEQQQKNYMAYWSKT